MINAIINTLIFSGITITFGMVAILLAERIIEEDINKEIMTTKEANDIEKDYVFMNDGTPVEYNEDDQE